MNPLTTLFLGAIRNHLVSYVLHSLLLASAFQVHQQLLTCMMQAKNAIGLAMKEATPEVSPQPNSNTQAQDNRYGQRERTQVVLYSPGRENGTNTNTTPPATTPLDTPAKVCSPSLAISSGTREQWCAALCGQHLGNVCADCEGMWACSKVKR